MGSKVILRVLEEGLFCVMYVALYFFLEILYVQEVLIYFIYLYKLLYKMGQDFLDIHIEQLNPESSEVELMIKFLDLKKMFFRTKNSFRSKLQKKTCEKGRL